MSLSDASFVGLREGSDGYFAACHHFEDCKALEITAHSFADPARILSKWTIAAARSSVEGNPLVWRHLDRFYVAHLSRGSLTGQFDYYLIHLNEFGDAELIELDWYDDSYDKMYQGIVSVCRIPDSENLIFSVQRDSEPVIYDPTARIAVGKIRLSGNYGNPKLHFRTSANELWAIDYDTLLRIETGSWTIEKSIRLQGDKQDGYQQFVGDFWFHDDDALCSVARPYSGDVVTLDMESFQVIGSTAFPEQPLKVAVIERMVFVRDWKTGQWFKNSLNLEPV
ncbi:MAG: hypothetical protein OEU46_20830 [Alphaproteobacteria bacterium]|nr:hypothetical protein [Alphaproteobacteria bacterium]